MIPKASLLVLASATSLTAQIKRPLPNVVFILADDLGYGDVGFNGQRHVRTPNIDDLARRGLQMTDFYAGCSVSAPSRASLMTGMHTGHTQVRGNHEIQPEGQAPMADRMTLGRLFQRAGYRTGIFGKWGLGYPGSGAEATDRGFDEFFGYNCQRLAHSYYPDHLWRGKERVDFAANKDGGKGVYSADTIHREALRFIEQSAGSGKPFFALLTYTLPHAELNLPHDAVYEYYEGKLTPREYKQRASWDYESSPNAHASFAAMVERLDRYTGEVTALIRRLGIEDNTIIIFTSDNGPHEEGGADPTFFNRDGKLRGLKRQCYEGGIRIPFIARWKGRIKEDVTSDLPFAFYDLMPTFCDVAGVRNFPKRYINKKKTIDYFDGISIFPTLMSDEKAQKRHPHLYWEFAETNQIGVRMGDWKLIVIRGVPHLYNLATDLHEDKDVAKEHPEIVDQMVKIIYQEHVDNLLFPITMPMERGK